MRGVQLVYNAGGSASSDVSGCVRLEDALREVGGYDVNPELQNIYYNYVHKGKVSIAEGNIPTNTADSEFIEQGYRYITLPELPASAFTDTSVYDDGRTILDRAHDFSDIAMVVVGRGAGEMLDFEPDLLRLQEEEEAMVKAVSEKFDKVILIVNSVNAMELDFVEEYPSIIRMHLRVRGIL